MSNLRGAINTSQFEQGIKKLDVRDFIFQLEPEEAPFVALLNKVRKESTKDVEFFWFEDRLVGKYTAISKTTNSVGYTAAATSLVVDDADIFLPYDIVKNTRTDEVMLVTAVNVATNTITVRRGWGYTPAAAIQDDDPMFKLGNAQKEGWTAPESMVTTKSRLSNYIQIFSRTVELTTTANAVSTYGGNRRNYERKKVALELKRDLESQLLFGEPKLDTSEGEPRYQTGGLLYFLKKGGSPNLNGNGKRMNKTAFDMFLRDAFTYGSSEKILIASPMIIGQINSFAEQFLKTDDGVKKSWGIRFQTYVNAFGTLQLISSRQFVGAYSGWGIVIDPKEIVYRYLEGLDFKLSTDIQPPNTHKLLDEYHGQCGLEVHLAPKHAYIYNVTDTEN